MVTCAGTTVLQTSVSGTVHCVRIAIYGRVSTGDGRQEVDNQLRELRRYCERRGWTVENEYVDEASGAGKQRPAYRQLFADAHRRRFDLLLFWAFLVGVVMALLLFITTYIRLSMQMHGARKRIKALETEVAILRNRPIEESADLLRGADDQRSEASSAFKES